MISVRDIFEAQYADSDSFRSKYSSASMSAELVQPINQSNQQGAIMRACPGEAARPQNENSPRNLTSWHRASDSESFNGAVGLRLIHEVSRVQCEKVSSGRTPSFMEGEPFELSKKCPACPRKPKLGTEASLITLLSSLIEVGQVL